MLLCLGGVLIGRRARGLFCAHLDFVRVWSYLPKLCHRQNF